MWALVLPLSGGKSSTDPADPQEGHLRHRSALTTQSEHCKPQLSSTVVWTAVHRAPTDSWGHHWGLRASSPLAQRLVIKLDTSPQKTRGFVLSLYGKTGYPHWMRHCLPTALYTPKLYRVLYRRVKEFFKSDYIRVYHAHFTPWL